MIALELVIYLWGTAVRNGRVPMSGFAGRVHYVQAIDPTLTFRHFSPIITGGCSQVLGVLRFFFKKGLSVPLSILNPKYNT